MAEIMTTNSQATTIALARRLAVADNRNQQAAIVQCAAKMLDGADAETKDSLMQLIAASAVDKHNQSVDEFIQVMKAR